MTLFRRSATVRRVPDESDLLAVYRLMYQLAIEQARLAEIRLRAKTRQAAQDREELQRYLRSHVEEK